MNYEEREIKLFVQNLPALADRLRICGADQTRERTLEQNLRLDTPENSLGNTGRLLRLRKDDRARVTYKEDAHFEDGVIARTEIEFTADDFSVTLKLFEALGYRVVVMYEKYRTVFRLGDVEVVLDEMPFGDFVEIEASSNALIDGVAQMLGLNMSKGIGTNYLGLFEIVKRNAKLSFNDLTFANFKDLEVSSADLEVEPADR